MQLSTEGLFGEVRRLAREGSAGQRAALLAAVAAGIAESADAPGIDAKAAGGAQQELTADDVAATIKQTRWTVYDLLKTGRLRGIKRGRLWRVLPSDLAAFQAASVRGIAPSKARGPRRLAA